LKLKRLRWITNPLDVFPSVRPGLSASTLTDSRSNRAGIGVRLGTDTCHRPAVVRNRRQRSRHHGLRRHASGSNVFAGMLLSGTPSDAPEPCDCNSRIVSCSSNSTRLA